MDISKRLTHQEFITKLAEQNSRYRDGEFSIESEYITAKDKITCKCRKHGYFKIQPDRLLRDNGGCPLCGNEAMAKKNAMPSDIFWERVRCANDDVRLGKIIVTGEYKNSNSIFDCCCVECGNIFKLSGISLLQGNCSCNVCGGNCRPLTHAQFILKLQRNNDGYGRGEFDVIGTYSGLKNKITCKCNNCGKYFKAPPQRLLYDNVSCQKCYGTGIFGAERVTDHESFLAAAAIRCPDIEFLSEYHGRHSTMKCRCKKCGNIFEQKPDILLRIRNGKTPNHCPRCGSGNLRSMDDFKHILKEINPFISVSGEYIDCKTKVPCHCNVCGADWEATPDNLRHGYGCPICASSHGERTILLFLQRNNVIYEREKEFDGLTGDGGGNLRYDFYLPDKNILIEYNGSQHYKSDHFLHSSHTGNIDMFDRLTRHDKAKRSYASTNGINLLTIGYWDFDNIDSILSHVLFNTEYYGAVEYDKNYATNVA